MVTVSVVTSTAFAGLMFVFARQMAAALGSVNAASTVRIMALAVIIMGVFAVPGAQLARDFRQDKIFLANAVSFVPANVVLLVLAETGFGSQAYAWSQVVGQFIVGCVYAASVKRHYLPGFAREAMDILLKFGLPLACANFVNFVLLNVDYALVGRLLGAVMLGVYVLAFSVSSWSSNLLSTVINNVSMPAFSRVKHDATLLRNATIDALRAAALVVMPICGLSVALARPIILTLFGDKWASSARLLPALAIYGAVAVICVLIANMLSALGRSKTLLVIQLVWLALLAPAMIMSVRAAGTLGAAVAHIIVILPFVLPFYLYALKKATGVPVTAVARAILPMVLTAAAAAAAAWWSAALLTQPLAQLIVGLLAGGLVYAIAIVPHATWLLGRAQAKNPVIARVMRAYNRGARLLGLPPVNKPRHTRRTVRRPGLAHEIGTADARAPLPSAEVSGTG
jgi:PST family polysaccharide transporter